MRDLFYFAETFIDIRFCATSLTFRKTFALAEISYAEVSLLTVSKL
jgi:hypothetical protein